MWVVALGLGQALAAKPPDWEQEWYAEPRLNVRAISVNGNTSAQALVGGEAGLKYAHRPVYRVKRHWKRRPADVLGRTRVQADLLYGLASSSFGASARLGSFIGPTSKVVTFQVGPDLWFNGYGSPGALDYHLPYGFGIDAVTTAIFTFSTNVTGQIGVIPGWSFTKSRQVGRVGPFHEITAFAVVGLRIGGFSVNIGYQRQYNAAGTTDSLILSGGL